MAALNPMQVRAIYNAEMAAHGLAPTRAQAGAFRDVVAFLRSQAIDPRAWVRARHDAIGWKFRIPPSKLVGTPEFLAKFREFGEARQRRQITDTKLVPVVQRRQEMTILGERAKAAYEGDRMLCEVMRDLTGGYSAQSKHCSSCERAGSCRARG